MLDVSLGTIRRLGILGGTFDPIHYGHLAIAEEARLRHALEAVLFIPAGAPPHKPMGQATPEQRYDMTLLATADHPQFFVSRMELERSGPSYTVETLRHLRAALPNVELFFILGADMAQEFHLWRDPQGIMQLATVIAATRPGFSLHELPILHQTTLPMPLLPLPAPGLDISSTELRQRAAAGELLRYLTPDAVASYIRKQKLYSAT